MARTHSNHSDVRNKIIKSSFEIFRPKIINPDNLFSCVPGLSETEANEFLSRIPPISLKEYHLSQQQKRTFSGVPLFYIVDVLNHLKQMCTFMLDDEALLEETEEISLVWENIDHIINIALPFFEKQATEFPFLSSESVIQRMSTFKINRETIEELIIKSLYGFQSRNPTYFSIVEPILFQVNKNTIEQSMKLLRIKAIMLNASFLKPKYCHFEIPQGSALKSLKQDELKLLNIEDQYDDTDEFVSDLQKVFLKHKTHSGLDHSLDKSLGTIIGFLNKLKEKNPSKTKIHSKKSTLTTRTRKLTPPWVELNSNTLFESTLLDDLHTLEIITVTTDEQDDDDNFSDKDISHDDITQDLFIQESDASLAPEVKIFNKTAQINHLELHNQFLKDQLTPTELESILTCLEQATLKSIMSEVKIRSLILISISLFTGYNLTQVGALRWVKGEKYRHSIANLNHDCSYIYIPIPRYKHTQTIESESYYDAQSGLLKLQVPSRFQTILFSLLTQYYALKPQTRQTLIKHNSLTPETIQQTIKGFKQDKRVNLNLIQNNFPSHALYYANGDQWAVAALSGREDITSSTQKHYTTAHLEYLQAVYHQTIAKIFNETLSLPIKPNIKSYVGDGDLFRPKKYKVITILNHLSAAITALYKAHTDKASHKYWRTQDLVMLHNLLTLFMETKQSYVIGSRNVTNPFITPEKLDLEGFYFWNDKNIQSGYTTRMGYLPSNLITEIKLYMREINAIHKKLKKKKYFNQSSFKEHSLDEQWGQINIQSKRRKRFVGFVLLVLKNKKIITKPYTRKKAARLAKTIFNTDTFPILKENANRHYFRSTLIERGLNPEYIDELMGHRHIGTETWNPKCLFNPIDFRRETKKVLDKLYMDFNVPSPLLNQRDES